MSPEDAALAKANETGQLVDVAGRTTETAKLSATPQGTLRFESSPAPARVKRDGAWREVDLTLEKRPDGSIAPRMAPSDISFGGSGSDRLLTLAREGKSMTLTWPDGKLPAPVLDSESATYADAGGQGIDLVVKATPTGVGTYVVVKTPEAAKKRSADPEQVAAGPGPGAQERPMEVEVTAGKLAVIPDQALLKAPDTKFPLVIDPPWQTWNGRAEADGDGYGSNEAGWTYVDEAHNTEETRKLAWKGTRLPTGREIEDHTNKRSYIRMNVDQLHRWAEGRRVKINKAEITFDTQHAWSCEGRDVWLQNMEKFGSDTMWHNRPGPYVPAGSGWANAWLASAEVKDKGRPNCGDEGALNDVIFRDDRLKRLVQYATDNSWDIFSLGIFPGENANDTHTWKVFDPDPRMVVEYSRYPDAPSDVHMTNGGTTKYLCKQGADRQWVGASPDRELRADLLDVDGDDSGGAQGQPMRGNFEIVQQWTKDGVDNREAWPRYFPDNGTYLQASKDEGQDAGKLEAHVPVVRQDPSDAPDGGTLFKWRVQAEDNTQLTGVWSPWCEFMVDDKRPNTPGVSSAGYPERKWSGYDPVARKYKTGSFTFSPAGSGDVVRFHYKFSDGTEDDETVGLGASVTVPWTPKRFGLQWVEVTAYDRAGNPSVTTKKYEFGVEQPPRDAAWSMDDAANNGVARAIAGTGVARPAADIRFPSGATQGEPGNLGGAVPADKSVKLNGSSQFGEVQPVLDTGAGGQSVPLVDTSKRFMFSTWAKLGSTSGDRVAVSQAAEDGSVFELGWIGGRWTLRHRKSDGTVLAKVVRDMAQAGNNTPWTEHWVSLMGGYDPIKKEIWLRTQAEGASEVCVPDEPWNCTTQRVMPEETKTAADQWTPVAGNGSLLFGAAPSGSGKGSYWNGWIDDTQLWPLAHPDENVLRVIYGETVQDQEFAGKTLRVVNAGGGHCMEVPGGSTANGAEVRQGTCNAGATQNWTFTDAGAGYYTLTSPHSGRCLNVAGASSADGANVTQYDCVSGAANEMWRPVPVPGGYRLEAKHSGKCLDVVGGSSGSGADIQQYNCVGGNAQLWSITKQRRHEFDGVTYRLKNGNSNKCADVEGEAKTDTAEVWQWDCHGKANQDWKFVSAGDGYYFLISGHTSFDPATQKCLDVAGGSGATQAGANVWQYACNWGDWQKWKVMPVGDDGALGYRLFAKHSGMALEVAGASTANGDQGNVIQYDPMEPVQAHQVWKLGCRPGEEWRCPAPLG